VTSSGKSNVNELLRDSSVESLPESFDVLIVGGGPIGLACAIELGRRKLSVLVVDDGDGVVRYPTAEAIDVRTMELLRRWSLADEVTKGQFPPDHTRDITFLTSLRGYELARLQRAPNSRRNEPTADISPEGPVWWPKYALDPTLRALAQSLPGVSLQYLTRCSNLVDGDMGVTADLTRLDGNTASVRATYVVGCDGAGSFVRQAAGIKMAGDSASATWQRAVLTIPNLYNEIRHAPAVQFYVLLPRPMVFSAMDGATRWRVMYPLQPGESADREPLVETLASVFGPELQVEIDTAGPWTGRAVVADTYQNGHLLLAGDAAHLMWPMGGHGVNTGFGDVANLGWKLEAVIRGWAGPQLLTTYSQERRGAAQAAIDKSLQNHAMDENVRVDALLDDPGDAGDALRSSVSQLITSTRLGEWKALGLQLGYAYADSSIVLPDSSPAPEYSASTYIPCPHPGHRAPHVPLRDGSSTLDLFAGHFTVLALDEAIDGKPLVNALRHRGYPVDWHFPDETRVREIYLARLVLVRPDGIIAWRGDDAPNDCDAIAATASGDMTPASMSGRQASRLLRSAGS
jgi:2-polyprenyl-6-methoxyphenol hydroxylase-like FAD-dependent oxidoreductase